MAKPLAHFILIISYLQINVIFTTNGFTLPLQTTTTKCESFTKKPQNKESNIGNEEVQIDSFVVQLDFPYSPFLPANSCIPSIVNRPLKSPLTNSQLNNGPEYINNNLPLMPKDPFLSTTFSDNVHYTINVLPTPPDSDLNTKNSITISEPNVNLESWFDSYQNLDKSVIFTNSLTNKPSGLKLPMTVSSTVTSIASPNILKSSDNFVDIGTDVGNKQSSLPSGCSIQIAEPILPLLDLVLPQESTFITPSANNPFTTEVKFQLPDSSSTNPLKCITSTDCKPDKPIHMANLMSFPNVNPLLPSVFDATSFELPQTSSFTSSSGSVLPVFSSNNNYVPISPGITIPLTVTSSVSTQEPLLKTFLPSDIEGLSISNSPSLDLSKNKFSLPLNSCSETSSPSASLLNVFQFPNTKQETLNYISSNPVVSTNNLQSHLCISSSVSNFVEENQQSTSPLRDFLNRVMPQTISLNNVLPNCLEKVPATVTASQNGYNLENSFSPSQISIPNSCIPPPLPLYPSNNQDVLNVLPNCGDSYNLPILSTVNNVSSLNHYLLSGNFMDINNRTPNPLIPTNPKLEMVYPMPMASQATSVETPLRFVTNSFVPPPKDNLQYPNSPLPYLPESISPELSPSDNNQINHGSYGMSLTSDQILLLSSFNSVSSCPKLYSSNVPDPKALAISIENPVASHELPLLPTNRNSPIEKYLKEVRVITSKLNEFISSFASRTSCTNTVTPPAASTILSPKILSEPKIIPDHSYFETKSNILPSQTCEKCDQVTLSPHEFCTAMVPIVPKTIVTACNFPINSSPEQYYNFQNSITSLSYNNFLPYSFPNINALGSYNNCFDYNRNLPSSSSKTTYGSFSENPFSQSKPSGSKRSIVAPTPTISTNKDGDTSIYVPNVLSTVSSKIGKNLSGVVPKRPLPYLKSVSINSVPECEEIMPSSRINIPSLSPYPVDPLSSSFPLPMSSLCSEDGSQMKLCSKNKEKLVALLEILKVLIDDVDLDFSPRILS